MQHAKKKPTNEIKLKNGYCFIYLFQNLLLCKTFKRLVQNIHKVFK